MKMWFLSSRFKVYLTTKCYESIKIFVEDLNLVESPQYQSHNIKSVQSNRTWKNEVDLQVPPWANPAAKKLQKQSKLSDSGFQPFAMLHSGLFDGQAALKKPLA